MKRVMKQDSILLAHQIAVLCVASLNYMLCINSNFLANKNTIAKHAKFSVLLFCDWQLRIASTTLQFKNVIQYI